MQVTYDKSENKEETKTKKDNSMIGAIGILAVVTLGLSVAGRKIVDREEHKAMQKQPQSVTAQVRQAHIEMLRQIGYVEIMKGHVSEKSRECDAQGKALNIISIENKMVGKCISADSIELLIRKGE